MAVAMSILCRDKSYYYEFQENIHVRIGKESTADKVIANLPFELLIFVKKDEANVQVGKEAFTVPFDEFIILDNDTQFAMYLTKLDSQAYTVKLPTTCEWSLGRVDEDVTGKGANQIVVGLPFVSSTHCKIIKKNNVISVVDSGSKNGLFLNGERIYEADLLDGDVLSIFTVQITLKGDSLVFKNAGSSFKVEKCKEQRGHKEAPKRKVSDRDYLFSRSPRMISHIESREIILEKPPQSNGSPQINWMSILITPAISVLLMLVLVVAMGMNAVMMIMSGTMSVVSAVVAIINYRKQKSQHENMESLVDKKYRSYLNDVSSRIENNKKQQLMQLEAANPCPDSCVSYAKAKDRRLWERSTGDEDFLCVRVGTGTIPSALTASYRQAEVVLSESELDAAAKKVVESSRYIEKAPILCDLAQGKLVGIVGNRTDEEQLLRNMIVEIATAHSYDEVKLVVLTSENESGLWEWTRWLPHCANDQMTERYVFTTPEAAEEGLDAINDILNRRATKDNEYSTSKPVDHTPHYVFVVLCRQMIEKHPIRKHLFSPDQNGCSCLFVHDNIAYLPKECNKIIEVHNGLGEIYARSNSSEKTKFVVDKLSQNSADMFARALAPLRINLEGQGTTLPSSISFLSGYGVSKPEQLNLAMRWKNAKTYKSLSVPIAAMAGGDLFAFDIHEKRHGVNGIVAGMPGSGKTEMVQSWLLSLAVNYSPQDVAFVLIDFKGTGMIAPFRNLPHLAGSISNLDTNIDRNLIAIQSEIHRREAIIDKYSNKNIKNINDLNRAFEKGIVPEKLPILLVVIDEYAEFKKTYPDFGAEVDSLTSKGRALGMFVVLMTQKPAGVVSAKSEDNIKFRWCLRVANYSASREMLGRPDAAKISVPGRAFIKVGEDDVYEQVQSFWSGAPFLPEKEDNGKTGSLISIVRLDGKQVACEYREKSPAEQSGESEIDVVVRHIVEFCEQNQIACAEKIWTEKLPERLALSDIQKACFTEERGWLAARGATPVLGLVDDPAKQQQYPLTLDFAKTGHVLIYGAPSSGKTTLLQTLIMSIAMSCSPDAANLYAMDFGGWNLNVLKDLPHVGGIANDNQPERIGKLVAMLSEILETRKAKFSAVGVGNVASYRKATNEKVPDIIVVVDNIGSALKLYPELDVFFGNLTGSGANYGIYLVASALATNAVPIRISQNIKYVLALQLTDKSDYTYTVGKVGSELPAVAGRGYAKGKPPLMFQTALPAAGDMESEITARIRQTAAAMNARWSGDRALQIPELPKVIPYGSVKMEGICLGLSTDKVAPVGVNFSQQHFLMISGVSQSGKTNLLCTIIKQIKESVGGTLLVFDVTDRLTTPARNIADKYLANASEIDAFIENIRSELQQRLEKKQKDPSATFAPITFAIDNYSQFFAKVSNDTISRLLAIIKLGKDLSLRLIATSDAYELTAMVNKGEATTLSMVRSDYSVMLGGCMNDHASITTKAAYAQKGIVVNEHEGYLVQKTQCTRFKAMNSLGE
ncbi:MAG: type VII secretion protein EssC [Ruminococcaceae bacterium]|nr:type VII secretion protein EssC [Oscillospiraceae bacterium]